MARTDTLGNFLTDVADAIREKTGSEETIQASEFDTAISEIPAGADLSEYFNTGVSGDGTVRDVGLWYKSIKKLPAFNPGTSMGSSYSRFNGTEIDLTTLIETMNNPTYNISFSGLFQYCYNLLNVDFAGLTRNPTAYNFPNMFRDCMALTQLDLSMIYNTNNSNCSNMFSGCSSLIKIDMRNFDFTLITYSTTMFGSSASDGPADDCLIIVADQTQKDWLNTNFSRLTNVQTVAEYEASLNS